MRGKKRLKQDIWATKSEKKDILVNGKKTGEKYDVYSKPVKYRCSVSATAGTPEETSAGIIPKYDREITVFNRSAPLSEGMLVFIDVPPQLDGNGELVLKEEYGEPVAKPDYFVEKVIGTQKSQVAQYGISRRT